MKLLNGPCRTLRRHRRSRYRSDRWRCNAQARRPIDAGNPDCRSPSLKIPFLGGARSRTIFPTLTSCDAFAGTARHCRPIVSLPGPQDAGELGSFFCNRLSLWTYAPASRTIRPSLLVVLLAAHIVAILLNPAPLKSGRTFGSQVLMAIYQPVQSVPPSPVPALAVCAKYLSLRDARAENTLLKSRSRPSSRRKAILNEQVQNR